MTSASWGGARIGAGRPKRGAIASEAHRARPHLSPRHPLHVIARVVRGAGALHDRLARRAIERALRRSLGRSDFRIVHLAVVAGRPGRAGQIELVVEAADRVALARGMQGFEVAAARHLNRAKARKGAVFADRYRARALLTRAAVRAVIGKAPAPGCPWTRRAWPETALLVLALSPHLPRPSPSPGRARRSRDPTGLPPSAADPPATRRPRKDPVWTRPA